MSELTGQLGLEDVLPKAAETPDGYDASGNLLDYEPQAPAETEQRLSTIAAEINAIKEQVRGTAISAALTIGKKLLEAQALAPRGRWTEWLRANVDYSERKAQDLMRMYEAYGRGTIPEAVRALDYTRAVALLVLPEEERAAMAERALEEGLSSRELQAEIKKLRAEREEDQTKIELMAEEIHTAEAAIRREREAAERARGDADAARDTADKLRKDIKRVKADASQAITNLHAARANENNARDEAERAKQELEALKSREPETVEVERVPEAVARELEQLRAQVGDRARSEAVVVLRAAYERLVQDMEALEVLLQDVAAQDADTGARYAQALSKACRTMAERFGK